LAQDFNCKSLLTASSWPNFWANPVTFTLRRWHLVDLADHLLGLALPLADDVRGGEPEEGRVGLRRHRLGEQRLSRARRPEEQDPRPRRAFCLDQGRTVIRPRRILVHMENPYRVFVPKAAGQKLYNTITVPLRR
jgi:hypothetical protein